MGPVPWRERARRIDVRHPSGFAQRLFYDLSQQRRFPTPSSPDNFCQSTTWQPAARQSGVERFHTGGQRADIGASRGGKREGEKIDEGLWKHLLFCLASATVEIAAEEGADKLSRKKTESKKEALLLLPSSSAQLDVLSEPHHATTVCFHTIW